MKDAHQELQSHFGKSDSSAWFLPALHYFEYFLAQVQPFQLINSCTSHGAGFNNLLALQLRFIC